MFKSESIFQVECHCSIFQWRYNFLATVTMTVNIIFTMCASNSFGIYPTFLVFTY